MSDQEELKKNALHFHRWPRPGKLDVVPSKPLENQRDLALAYSPGVAAACEAIVADNAAAAEMTIRGNLVAVVSNGTAVLGLGAIGPLASKPVMEGKAVLFKRFANIDVFDIEVDATDPQKFVEVVAALEPTFGAINLEDIKAPDCFIIEQALRERMNIPVFHDDQHGTAIVVAAAVINALRVVEKDITEIKLVSSGGGAAGIACLNQLLDLGLKRENVTLTDHLGVCYPGRDELTEQKAAYARETDARTLADAMKDADVFLGLSAPGIVSGDMVKSMADNPIILALANPTPEILPDVAREAVPDAIIATGRSDFSNQVNNVLCFPFIFRGALDVGATEINEDMKRACVYAIADLTMAETSEAVAKAYGSEDLRFGPEYLIPKPFDPRLISVVSAAVAKAAMDSGVATRPIEDMDAYIEKLSRFVNRSGLLMKPIYDKARSAKHKRVVFAEGEDERVLRAVKVLIDEEVAQPIIVGRPEVVKKRIEALGLDLKAGEEFEVVNPEKDDRYRQYWYMYHMMMDRKGLSPESAKTAVRTNNTVIAALMVHFGHADAMICGTYGQYHWHLQHVLDVLGRREPHIEPSTISLMIMDKGAFFMCDTFVSEDPTEAELIDMVLRASARVKEFGMEPKIALVSHGNFGARSSESARKMQRVIERLHKSYPDLEVEGEMQADLALNAALREATFPHSKLKGRANLLIMPTLDAANISLSLLKEAGRGLVVGPMLLGVAKPAQIATSSTTSRGLVDLAALAVVDVLRREAEEGFSSSDPLEKLG